MESDTAKSDTGSTGSRKSPVERKRASKPKVKTGCLTCKTRHVKCDEAKPKCRRCITCGYVCDGYEEPFIKQQNTAPRPIFPQTTPQQPAPSLMVIGPGQTLTFRNETEYRYFQAFQDDLIPELTGAYLSSVWSRIVLQVSHDEPFVRDAVVAIAALRLSLGSPAGSTSGAVPHYEHALQKYGQALRIMRTSLSDSSRIRVALVSCLLVFCFESLHGNHYLAASNARTGFRMLQEWKASQKATSATQMIDDDLEHAFSRLDIQSMTVVGPQSLESHSTGAVEGENWIQTLPAVFEDLDEAHRYWVVVLKRTAHFIWTIYSEQIDQGTWKLNVDIDYQPPVNLLNPFDSSPILHLSPTVKAGQSKYAAEMAQWQSALQPLMLYSSLPIRRAAIVLQLLSITTEIVLLTIDADESTSVDVFLPQFKSLLSLSEEFLQHETQSKPRTIDPIRDGQTAFTVDLGVIPGLYIVVRLCRDREVRRAAINLLRSYPRQEGMWNSGLIAEIGEWVMGIEEDGQEEDMVASTVTTTTVTAAADAFPFLDDNAAATTTLMATTTETAILNTTITSTATPGGTTSIAATTAAIAIPNPSPKVIPAHSRVRIVKVNVNAQKRLADVICVRRLRHKTLDILGKPLPDTIQTFEKTVYFGTQRHPSHPGKAPEESSPQGSIL